MFVDTHAHIYSNEFSADIDEVIQRAVSAGIQKIILPSIDKSHFNAMKQIENAYPQLCVSLIGVHPSSAGKETEFELRLVEEELDAHNYHGIGEIGVDLYWDKTFLQQQVYAFESQLRMAVKYNLPVVIHQRESFPQILDVINRQEFDGLKGIFHCYAGDVKTAESLIKKGFLLGIEALLHTGMR
jgi:TatD DNase family protein